MKAIARALLISLALVVAAPVTAVAHECCGWQGFYPYWWKGEDTMGYRFTEGFPGGDFDDRIRDAINNGWDAIGEASQPLWYQRDGGDYANFDFNRCPRVYRKNSIHWVNLAGPAAAVKACVADVDNNGNYELESAAMAIDSDPKFRDGSDADWNATIWGPDDPGEWDLWSVALHEWGHMNGSVGSRGSTDGKGHFVDGSTACPTDYALRAQRNVMCPWHWLTETTGSYLRDHDEHTFAGRY